MTDLATPLGVLDAIAGRRSIRSFLPREVPRATVEAILEVAARAPSGSNIQPWKVTVLTGAPLAALTAGLHALALAGDPGSDAYTYYPKAWREPYLARRRKVGWDLYGALGISRRDTDRMRAQTARNFLFFDAPVGLLFTIDRDMELGSWLDYGMFLENIMIAARGFGLDTCPQAAFITYAEEIARRLAIPDTETLVCGMALGFADPDAPENRFETERAPVSTFTRFVDRLD
ncbi:nitroreductase [Xanthobacter autotrophicus DSM 431]|uniref:nitroreductase n=1 Tax=Xanthobacter nonsaccharivorans TaxID=3119912 RepID=UPI00372991D6